MCLALFLATAPFGMVLAQGTTADPDRWQRHLSEDLLPFWSSPAATGSPAGAFPGRRCNDGSLPVPGVSCSGVSAFQASNPVQTLVAHSRQVFSYGVAFHMTGDRTWLDLARAGLDYQFSTFLDPSTGLFFESHTVNTGATGPADIHRQSQKQAYGLLGPSFIYYLTRDADLFQQISGVKQAIDDTFFDPETGAYRFVAGSEPPGHRIVDHLDQLNSYKVLMAQQAPAAYRQAWQAEALKTAHFLKDNFYDPTTGLFKATLGTPDGSVARADFGHAIKSLWFIDQIAEMTGDRALAEFAKEAADGVLSMAYIEEAGAWGLGFDADETPDNRGVWWVHAELDQYMSALAIDRPEYRDKLAVTQAYWLEKYVDHEHGGIWTLVDPETGEPDRNASKHWEWQAGFHSFEHALISYLSAGAMAGEDLPLYFARPEGSTEFDLAYGYSAASALVETLPDAAPLASAQLDSSGPVQRVTYSGLGYGSQTVTPVPAPPALALFAVALVCLAGLRRRRASA